jgi:hypothetical protein
LTSQLQRQDTAPDSLHNVLCTNAKLHQNVDFPQRSLITPLHCRE